MTLKKLKSIISFGSGISRFPVYVLYRGKKYCLYSTNLRARDRIELADFHYERESVYGYSEREAYLYFYSIFLSFLRKGLVYIID